MAYIQISDLSYRDDTSVSIRRNINLPIEMLYANSNAVARDSGLNVKYLRKIAEVLTRLVPIAQITNRSSFARQLCLNLLSGTIDNSPAEGELRRCHVSSDTARRPPSPISSSIDATDIDVPRISVLKVLGAVASDE